MRLAAGAQHYLEKPFDFEQLVQEVKTYCGPFLCPALVSVESLAKMDAALRQQEYCGVAKVF